MLNSQTEGQNWNVTKRHSSPFLPIVFSILAVLVWLIFILFYALYWSRGYGPFQDFVVLFATLFITAILIGLMWLIWGRTREHWWSSQNW